MALKFGAVFSLQLLRNKDFDFVPVELILRNVDEGCEVCCTLRLQRKFPYLAVENLLLRNVDEGCVVCCALRLRKKFPYLEMECLLLRNLIEERECFVLFSYEISYCQLGYDWLIR